ncbi:MAG: methylmalonyl-CoA mutase family protein [bacterium]
MKRAHGLSLGSINFKLIKTAEGQWFRVNDTIARTQRERLTTLRNKRDNRAVKEALARLADTAANEDENIVPVILEAVRAYATLGEICGVLRQVFGEYHSVQYL